MPPGTRRANRGGYADHDDFEGLPVRQWRLEPINVEPPQPQEQSKKNDIWDIELPYGMPKDANLLPAHSLELLRAARSGRLYKRPSPVEEEEADADALLQDTKDKKEEDNSSKGFAIKVWKQLPRNVEAPTISYLAKRRKGMVTIASKTSDDKIQGPTVTRATVRRIDAAGNAYTEEVTLGENQQVDGEIISTRIEAVSAAVAESINAPPVARRRPPIPKRKFKPGPGRGRKRMKLPLPENPDAARMAPTDGSAPDASSVPNDPGSKLADDGTPNPDSEMADADDQDDNDDNSDEEDGEEGDGDDDDQNDNDPATTADEPAPRLRDQAIHGRIEGSPTTAPDVDVEMKDVRPSEDPDLPKAPDMPHVVGALLAEPQRAEGSPLKHVSMAASSPPGPAMAATTEPAAQEEGSPIQPFSREMADQPRPTEALITEPTGIASLPEVIKDEAMTESVLAEPPSTIVGEAPEDATTRDVPSKPPLHIPEASPTENLLPPPPDQVGNIETPKSEEPSRDNLSAESETSRTDIAVGEESVPQRPPVTSHNSAMTEDSIKPDDSASVVAPANDPVESSDVNLALKPDGPQDDISTVAAVVEDVAEAVKPQINIQEDAAESVTDIKARAPTSPVQKAEVDIMGGLMGDLDRREKSSAVSEQRVPDKTATDTPEAKGGGDSVGSAEGEEEVGVGGPLSDAEKPPLSTAELEVHGELNTNANQATDLSPDMESGPAKGVTETEKVTEGEAPATTQSQEG